MSCTTGRAKATQALPSAVLIAWAAACKAGGCRGPTETSAPRPALTRSLASASANFALSGGSVNRWASAP